MKVGFIYSEKSKGYEELIQKIIDTLAKEYSSILVENIQNKVTRKKYDLYVLFSDDFSDTEYNLNKYKCNNKVILITSNLNEKYITYCIDKVKDIVYAKNTMETIYKRISDGVKRNLC